MKIDDIWSQRALHPAKGFKGLDECIARACSVFTNQEDLNKFQRMPKFKMKKMVAISIKEQDGVLLKTFSGSHFSWWISKKFNLAAVTIAKESGR